MKTKNDAQNERMIRQLQLYGQNGLGTVPTALATAPKIIVPSDWTKPKDVSHG